MNTAELVYYFVPLIGIGTLVIGILAVIRPEPMSKKFGIAVSASALPYVISTGVRDIFIGLTVLVLFYRQEWFTLGFINICIGVVATSDFLVVRKHGDTKTSLAHLFGAVIVVTFGIWLICK